MIGLDTNVLIRLLVKDDAKQLELATQAIDGSGTVLTFDGALRKNPHFTVLR